MLSITIVCVGNLKESYLREAEAEYKKRLSAYANLKITELRDGEPIIPHLPKKALKVALCIEGKQFSSEELADYIEKAPIQGHSDICFIIGGFAGLPEEVKKEASLRLSFSRMTFTHQIMRIILIEQIYRAFTIITGGKYHK